MKTRLLPLSLALTALLALPAAALSDVPETAWYADAVQICLDRGLMKGTGSDTFSPDNAVTLAEVMTVAVRLHYQWSGGVGDPPAAPADWGTGTLTTPAGAVLLRFDTCDLDRGLTYRYDQESPRRLHLYLTVSRAELAALTPAGGAAEAVLTLNNTVVAPPRMLIAFLENNLQADGSVKIPAVLRPYMGGKEVLVPKK